MRDDDSKTQLGFWIYLMTDCVLFGSLFATLIVLRANDFVGPSGDELFKLPFVLAETLILLTSSFTCGLAVLFARQGRLARVMPLLALTFMLGVAFLTLELSEFHQLAAEGHSWRASGYLAGFFTLVGTHGLHITAGLVWLLTLLASLGRRGIDNINLRRLTLFSLFWHFLDIVWIFIFTIVYLAGVV